jgi:glycosyltransferase involved in cell wall biosynthesis
MRLVEFVGNFSHGDGMSRVVLELAKRLRRWYDLTVVYRYAAIESIREPGLRTLRLGRLAAVRHLARHADVVHSHFGPGLLLADLAKALSPRLRHLHTHHVIPPRAVVGSPWLQYHSVYAATWLGLRLGVDRAVGISRYAVEDLRRLYGVPGASLVQNGVDPRAFRPDPRAGRAFREKHDLPPEARLVGYAARFNRQKNHELLIRLACELPRDALLVLGGAPSRGPASTYDACVSLTKRLGVADRVRFLGYLPDSDLRGFYNSLDVFAFASLYESFGLPPLEAMCCETPVVTLDGYAYPELVDFRRWGNGFRARDEREFGRAVIRLLADPSLARACGRRGRRFAQTFDWEKKALEYKRLIDPLAG